MKKLLCTLFLPVIMLLVLISGSSAFAEGSAELTANGGYRPYIEWSKNVAYSNGIDSLKRRQTIKVYVKAGETVYFGSSQPNAQFSREDASALDIRVIYPDNTVYNFDVIENGVGFISGPAQERVGPNGVGGVVTGGYAPLSFTAVDEGIYSFQFFSEYTDANPNSVGSNTGVPITAASEWDASKQRIGVAAWDITVVDAQGEVREGRAYANYLSLNLGNNVPNRNVLNSIVYVLTYDGYIYETNFNGLDPYGFLFFANNRGLVDKDTKLSFFHSSMYKSNSADSLLGNVYYKLPVDEGFDENGDITYRIFFNYPCAEALAFFGLESPQPPSVATGFAFNENRASASGAGGDFVFTTSKASSYQIKISCPDGNDVFLSNISDAGKNTVHWDGKDSKGNIVPVGSYSATLQMKGGEYHFPMGDAEQNRNGTKIHLLNVPSFADADFKPDLLFYDNSDFVKDGDTVTFTDAAGRDSNTNAYFTGSLTRLDGVPSLTSPAIKYTVPARTGEGFGNWAMLDVWTYFSARAFLYSTPVEVSDLGSLSIEKIIEGDGAESGREFEFTVSLYASDGATELSAQYPYSGSKTGKLASGGKLTLKGGEKITIAELPAGCRYRVTETDYSSSGYTSESENSSGTIAKDSVVAAAFTNTRNIERSTLKISKSVAGKGADKQKKFSFTVSFTGDNLPSAFEYTGSVSGSIANGGSVELSDAESVTFSGLPVGCGYTVTEGASEGYISASTGASGTIAKGGSECSFTNTIHRTPQTGDSAPVIPLFALLLLSGALLAAALRRSAIRR